MDKRHFTIVIGSKEHGLCFFNAIFCQQKQKGGILFKKNCAKIHIG
jgi:hypothetical protein